MTIIKVVNFFALLIAFVLVMTLLFTARSRAHEHQDGESEEQARVVEFYRTWKRPKGDFSVPQREYACCYGAGVMRDCFPVRAVRKDREGVTEILLDTDTEYGARWYKLNHGINEDQQAEPRESPDGRSHACVVGSEVVCYVPGSGQ